MNKDRKAVENHLYRLCEGNQSRLTPQLVLDDARSEESPLHDLFEWNDTLAAEQFRLAQARIVIRNVRYVFHVNHQRLEVANYVRDPESQRGEAAYRPVLSVKRESDIAHDVVNASLTRARLALESARRYAALFGIQEKVEEWIDGIAVGQARLTHPVRVDGVELNS